MRYLNTFLKMRLLLEKKYEITPDPKLSHDEGKEYDHIDEELGKDESLVDTNESTTDKAD